MIDPAVATEAKAILSTVVSSGTGTTPRPATRPGARPAPPTTTATPGSAARTPRITACVWVGFPDAVTPMETEFGGAPVDGGTYPALIFSRVVARLRLDAWPLATTATRSRRRQRGRLGGHRGADRHLERGDAATESTAAPTESSEPPAPGAPEARPSTGTDATGTGARRPRRPAPTPAAARTGGAAAGSAGGVSPG